MNRNIFYVCFIFMVLFLSCQSDNVKNRSYTLQELENNKQNALNLPPGEQPDIYKLNEELSVMDRAAVEKFLQKKGLTFFDASYGLHFLGNRYFADNDFNKGLFYQHLSADEYMNPYAMLKLAIIYSKKREEILSSLPEGTNLDFQRDFAKSFRYLHRAINTAILTMENFNDRTAIDDINRFGRPLIELFEKKDSSVLGDFDIKAAEEKAAKNLKNIESDFIKVYRPLKDKSQS